MWVYLHPSGTENPLQNAYIGEYEELPIPTSWLLGYRPLQLDLEDASWNWNNASWYSWTWSFSINAWKTWARVTMDGSYNSTQHIITTLTYEQAPITMCGWICYNSLNTSNDLWTWLMSSSSGPWNWWTMWCRSADNYYPTCAMPTAVRIASSVPSVNTWYFRCGTREWTTVKTYLNWVYANSWTVSSWSAWGAWKLWCAMVDWVYRIDGTDWWVRQCAIYNRALSASEVLEYYNATA